MQYTLYDLRDKSVVNVKDGVNFGCVDDVVIDAEKAQVVSLVIYGKKKLFGLLGREPDFVVSWNDIRVIGNDVVLVSVDSLQNSNLAHGKKSFIKTLFN